MLRAQGACILSQHLASGWRPSKLQRRLPAQLCCHIYDHRGTAGLTGLPLSARPVHGLKSAWCSLGCYPALTRLHEQDV